MDHLKSYNKYLKKEEKINEEYKYFPWTMEPGDHDPDEPYWVWKKKKYKKNKTEKMAVYGNISKEDKGKINVSENAIVINLNKINEILDNNLNNNLKKLLLEIKKSSIVYEQTDDYPPSFLKFENLNEDDINTLKEMGFDVNENEKIIAWKWK